MVSRVMSTRLLSSFALVSSMGVLGLLGLMGCGPSEGGASPAGDGASGIAEDVEVVDDAPVSPPVSPPLSPKDLPQTLRSQEEPPAEVEAPPTPDPPGMPDLTGWQVGTGHRGVHTVAWRVVDRQAVPRNEEFEIDVLILRDGEPQPGMRLAVSGWMPEHDHGLVRSPLLEEVGKGRYRVSGMLLHMRGSWQLRFQVFAGRDTETATFDVEL